jgi:nucleotide-binding universal stress UspA family protein
MRALDHAALQAALKPAAELHVLLVEPPVLVYGEAAAYTSDAAMETKAAEDCRAILDAARSRVANLVPPVQTELQRGDPAETIVRRAVEIGCESIVLGTHGRGRLGQTLLGSVAQKVVHTSHVPVTLVR